MDSWPFVSASPGREPRVSLWVISLMYVVLVSVGAISAWLRADIDGLSQLRVIGWTLAVLLPMIVMVQWPLMGATVVLALFCVHRWLVIEEETATSIAAFVAMVVAGANGDRRRTVVRAVCMATIIGVFIEALITQQAPPDLQSRMAFGLSINLLYNGFFFAAAWSLGDLLHSRRMRNELLARTNTELELARDHAAHSAVFADRVRIARELHDVVAHHVSVMGIQAGAARRVLDRSPADARDALTSIEGSSRQAVGELYRMLGLLRDEGTVDTSQPQPTLADIADLADSVRASGLDVAIAYSGTVRELAPGLELTAYRVVQEAITNTMKHARARRVHVAITYGDESLVVQVDDDGFAPLGSLPSDERPTSGLGLTGMRERVAILGGRVTTGRQRDGGFRVRAELPMVAP
jgi:signal transduction histidine kinase